MRQSFIRGVPKGGIEFIGSGTISAQTPNTPTTIPTPVGTEIGDLMVVIASGGAGFASPAYAGGLTLRLNVNALSSSDRFSMAAGILTTTSPTYNSNTFTDTALVAFVFRGADYDSFTRANDSNDPPSISGAAAGDWVVAGLFSAVTASTPTAAPSGYDDFAAETRNDQATALAYTTSPSDPENAGAFSVSPFTASNRYDAISVLIKPQ